MQMSVAPLIKQILENEICLSAIKSKKKKTNKLYSPGKHLKIKCIIALQYSAVYDAHPHFYAHSTWDYHTHGM